MGLIDEARKPQAAAAPESEAPQEDVQQKDLQEGEPSGGNGATGGEQPTPQEQEAYDRVVMAGMKVIYDKTTHQGVMQMVAQQKDEPAKALAYATCLIVEQLDKQSGGKIPQTVILPAAAEIMGLIAELADAAGLFKADDRIMGQATQELIIDLAKKYGVDPADIQGLMQGMDKGKLNELVAQQGQFAQPAQAAPAQPQAAPTAPPAATAAAPVAQPQPGA